MTSGSFDDDDDSEMSSDTSSDYENDGVYEKDATAQMKLTAAVAAVVNGRGGDVKSVDTPTKNQVGSGTYF